MTMHTTSPDQDQPGVGSRRPGTLTLREVMGSVLAAGFGVQSKENKVRDFSHGRPLQFIVTGVTFTIALLAGLIILVNLIV
jgi:hypothetical protein